MSIPNTLMQNLYYPAALGTGLVLLLYKILGYQSLQEAVSDIRNWFAILLVVYFSLSYLANDQLQRVYGWDLFSLDFAEVMLLLAAFYYLGFFTPAGNALNLRGLYGSLGVIPVLHFIWNYQSGDPDVRRWCIVFARFTILGVGGLIGYRWQWYSVFTLFALSALTIIYC